MSNVTRFGPSPLLDNEIANKEYVDGSSGGAGYFVLSCHMSASAGNTVFFCQDSGNFTTTGDGTESETSQPLLVDATLIKINVTCGSNTKNGDSLFMFRHAGSDEGIVTIGAGLRGLFEGSLISIAITAGDLINFKRDMTASSSGNLSMTMLGHFTT